MKGCRALTADEVARVSQAFYGTYAERDRALFILERFPTGCMGSVSVFLDGQALRIHMCHTSE
jgi:hypothetical protein